MIAFLLKICYLSACRLHLTKPFILVNVDGGICSQMQQYLMGDALRRRGNRVRYDLSFFQYGKDNDGRQVRNFDLLKAFPEIQFHPASRWQKSIYRRCFKHIGTYPEDTTTDWLELKAPVFLGGYYQESPEMYTSYRELFQASADVLDTSNQSIYQQIPDNAVAVHIRRGDLSHYTEAYGDPASADYFVKAMTMLEERLHHPRFYMFSDGMDYVRQEILPQLPEDIEHIEIENGAEHGYYDLMLMSRCSHHITSKGSLAKFAACMNPNKGIVITLKNDRQLGPLAYFDKEMIAL